MFDLTIEWWEDHFAENPDAVLAQVKESQGGEIMFSDTGDPLLDKWESEIAKGVVPDLEEGLSPKEKDKLIKEREKAKLKRPPVRLSQGFEDDYADPKMSSKFVHPGSKDERELLRNRSLGKGGASSDIRKMLLGQD